MWSHEAISAERYRPLLTAGQRKKLLEQPDDLERKEYQRLRNIALAGIYDLMFMLNFLPNDERDKIFSYMDETRLQDSWTYHYPAEGETWQAPGEIEFRQEFIDLLESLDETEVPPHEAIIPIFDELDREPKLADASIETRQELLRYQAELKLLDFDVALFGLLNAIELGLEANGISMEDFGERIEGYIDGWLDGQASEAEDAEKLEEFRSRISEISSDGSLVRDIE